MSHVGNNYIHVLLHYMEWQKVKLYSSNVGCVRIPSVHTLHMHKQLGLGGNLCLPLNLFILANLLYSCLHFTYYQLYACMHVLYTYQYS